jgi:hypothetical protein
MQCTNFVLCVTTTLSQSGYIYMLETAEDARVLDALVGARFVQVQTLKVQKVWSHLSIAAHELQQVRFFSKFLIVGNLPNSS